MKNFDVILAKNRIARELKELYKGGKVPEYILKDFDAIERKTGTSNQPTATDILTSKQNI